MELKDLYSKYNIVSNGLQRSYVISVNERRYDMENTSPVCLAISVDRAWDYPEDVSKTLTIHRFNQNSWLRLIETLALYLQEKAPKPKEELLAFKVEWSDAVIFSDYKAFANMVEFGDLYLSVNFTATHSSWIIGDLLDFYGVAKHGCDLTIHRAPIAEPKEVLDYIEDLRKKEFKEYLISICGLNEDKADVIINSFKVFNKLLAKMTASYYNFFLFDDATSLSNCKSKLILNIDKYVSFSESQKKSMKKYLDYYTDYYTSLKKKAKKNSGRP